MDLLKRGGLDCGQDADSLDPSGKKMEGAFYLWSAAEVDEVLGGGPQAKLFAARYGVRPEGNCTLSPRRHAFAITTT